ncbi:hypothetical protein INT43_004358 [Umbelopsis isabellina]|uniref:MRH domain-containing protein n=1 Tax=Mortierella isabellina TaxID=91625 RepID=A0A8H7U974_MORIS|nr:hypothetical protein INT43_004358 [Umbelopsis isabellina]
MRNVAWIFIVILAAGTVLAQDANTCTTKDSKGNSYDLNPLKHTSSETDWTFHDPDSSMEFRLNICGELQEKNTGLMHPEGVGAFTKERSESKGYSIGQYSEKPFFRGDKLMLKYTEGQACPRDSNAKRSTLVSFICDRGVSDMNKLKIAITGSSGARLQRAPYAKKALLEYGRQYGRLVVKAGPPFDETNAGAEIDTADDAGKAIADNADAVSSDDGEEDDVDNEWAGDNDKSVDEFGEPVSVSDDADEEMADKDDEEVSDKEMAVEDNVDWGSEDNELEPSAEELNDSADEDNTEDPFAKEDIEDAAEGSSELEDEKDSFALGSEDDETTTPEAEPSDEEDSFDAGTEDEETTTSETEPTDDLDPFAMDAEDEEDTGSSTEDLVEEDPLASEDDDMEPTSSESEETDDADAFAVNDKDDVGKVAAGDPEENEFGYDENESSTPTENVAGADDDTEGATEETETTETLETSDAEDSEFPEKYPTTGLDDDQVDNNTEESISPEEILTADEDNDPEEEINDDGTIEVEDDSSDNNEIDDDQNETSDKDDDFETTEDDLTEDGFDKTVSDDDDDDEMDEDNGDDAAVDTEVADEAPENPNAGDETSEDPDDPTGASVDDEPSEEDSTSIGHGDQDETKLDKVQQEDPDVQPAAGHTTHGTSETVQDDMDTDTAYPGANDNGYDYTQYGSTYGSSHVQYQGAILIAAVGVVGLFMVKRSRETIIQGVQKLSGRQSDQGQYSHLPLNATGKLQFLSDKNVDTPNHNLSNTTSEWAVDMSNAIDHDHQDESKPSRGMKLSHSKKASQTNSIPLKPVQDRKSQEWADWKEDEEDW